MNYANQQVAYIQPLGPLEHKKDEKREDGSKKDFLVALNWDEKLNVSYVLNGNEYKVWDYFLKWRGSAKGYEISPSDIEEQINISESTFRRIKKRFIELEILVKTGPNTYNFVPYPKKVEEEANRLFKEKYKREKRRSRSK